MLALQEPNLPDSGMRNGTQLASDLDHAYVRFGSKADMCAAKRHVCFTPNSDRESEIPQKAMSALPPKADMCGATGDVRFGPIADTGTITSVQGATQLRAAKPP